MSYPIIICEDNLPQLQRLATIIENYIQFHNQLSSIVLKSDSPYEIIEYVEKFSLQGGIYFLDIDLKQDINGIDLAERIRQTDDTARIIFVTTHDELALQTFKRKAEAIGFITKDQPLDDFRQEIQDILETAEDRNDAVNLAKKGDRVISFTYDNQVYNVEDSELYFIEASPTNSHKLELYARTAKFEFYGKLKDYADKYPFLVKASRSCLVNPKSIKHADFNANELVFAEGLSRKVSSLHKKKLKQAMLE